MALNTWFTKRRILAKINLPTSPHTGKNVPRKSTNALYSLICFVTLRPRGGGLTLVVQGLKQAILDSFNVSLKRAVLRVEPS